MRYLDRLVLKELSQHRDPEVSRKAKELLRLLETGQTAEAPQPQNPYSRAHSLS